MESIVENILVVLGAVTIIPLYVALLCCVFWGADRLFDILNNW